MHVVVVGCGRVGAGVARSVEAEGHSVAVIDRQARAFERLPEGFGGSTVLGVGFDRDRLEAAGIADAAALAAVTNGDNSNILVARVARETFGVERVVARIYDPRRARIYERLGIPTIATVGWSIERTLQRVLPDRPSAAWIDPSAQVMLVERELPPTWAGHHIRDLDLGGHARVASLTRIGAAHVAGADTVLQDGDVLHVMVGGDSLDRFDHHLAQGPTRGSH